jgi:hypothetical protein
MGFLAVSAFPLPKEHLSGINLPAGLSIDGKHYHHTEPLLQKYRANIDAQNGTNFTTPS